MKPDLYTKAVLTVIALLLLLIACNQYVNPAATASAQGPFAGVQFSDSNEGIAFFDSRTWDVSEYSHVTGELIAHYTVNKLGQPGLRVK